MSRMTQMPASWYPDPEPSNPVPGRLRYWDGNQWTAHLHDPGTLYPATPYPPRAALIGVTPDGQPLADWWQRVLALILDGFILLPLHALVLTPVFILRWDSIKPWFDDLGTGTQSDTADPLSTDLFGSFLITIVLVLVLSLVVSTTYNALFLRWKQATPGKLMVGLRVRRRDTPGPLPWSTIALRVGLVSGLSLISNTPLVGTIASLGLLLNGLWPLWDDKKQALHDKVAGTNVVRVR